MTVKQAQEAARRMGAQLLADQCQMAREAGASEKRIAELCAPPVDQGVRQAHRPEEVPVKLNASQRDMLAKLMREKLQAELFVDPTEDRYIAYLRWTIDLLEGGA